MEVITYKIDNTKSSIEWTGKKVNGAHHGTISIKEGYLRFEQDQLTNGRITIDVTTIKVLDISDPLTNAQVTGHLVSCDFFDADEYPEACFDILSVSGTGVQGDLTIKGLTHSVCFDAKIEQNSVLVIATGRIVVDRTRYGMKFRSGSFFKDLGDRLIDNDFILQVSVFARAIFLEGS